MVRMSSDSIKRRNFTGREIHSLDMESVDGVNIVARCNGSVRSIKHY